MPPKVFPFLLHTTAVAVMTYGYFNLPDVIGSIPVASLKGGHFQFLTIQGLAVTWITMVLSVGHDLAPSSNVLKNVKRAFLMTSLPLSILISAIYWALLLTVPHMILQAAHPVASEPTSSSAVPELVRLPLHIDLEIHAAPAIASIIDFYGLERKYSKNVSRYGSIILIAFWVMWYGWWVEYCASYNGFFPYPFLTENPFNIRVAIYLGAGAFALAAFKGLNALHS